MPGTSLIPQSWHVPDVFRRRLGDDVGRQRAMVAEGHLLLVLHAPPLPDEDVRRGRLFWRQPGGTWMPKGLKHGELAVDELLSEYDALLNEADKLEDVASTAREHFDLLARLNPLVRSSRNLHTTVQEAREAVPEDRALILLRDRAYSIARRAELLQNDAQNALDFAIARRAEEQAHASHRMERASHRLNLLVAFFFPVATLTAVFGMELRNGLEPWDEQYGPGPMLTILGIGLVMGLLLTLVITRERSKN